MPSIPHRRAFLAGSSSLALSASTYTRITGANERVGLGFIGYGLIGKKHVATFKAVGGCDLVAVADAHRGRTQEGVAAAGPGAMGFADFRKLLDDRRVQAVVIATPDHWHALMTMLACAAGKDVYVEKPLTLFIREGEWMKSIAARHQRVVQVGTQQRSGKHYQRARDLIRGGHIGRITNVRMTAVRNVFPGFGTPPDGPPPPDLDYDLWLGPAPRRPYNPNRSLYHFRWFWDYSGGQMTNLGAHHLDIVDWYLGLDALRAVSSLGGRFALTDNGETPDTQDTIFHGDDHWTASLTIRESCAGVRGGYGLEFHGTKGTLGISRSGFTVTPDPDLPPANQVPGVKDGHPVGGPIPVPATNPARLRTEAIDDKTGNSDDQYAAHARNFLECIRSRKTPISDLASAQRVAVACHLANLSLRLGRSLTWDRRAQAILGDNEASRMLTRPYRAPWDKELQALGVS